MTNEEFIKSISLEGEIWKDVIGYEETYMVSSKGRICSLGRLLINSKGIKRWWKPHIMKQSNDGKGYFIVNLWLNNHSKICYVHRLVAKSFIDNVNHYDQVDHIDGNPKNNNVYNLRFCTQKMNLSYPLARKHNSEAQKRRLMLFHPNSKNVVGINTTNNSDIIFLKSQSESKKLGFIPSCVSLCCRNKINQHKGYKWMFLSDYEAQFNKSKNS